MSPMPVLAWAVSINFFLWMGHTFLLFKMPQKTKLDILNIIMWQLWKVDSIPLHGLSFILFIVGYYLFPVAFLNYFVRFLFFLIRSHWSLFYISLMVSLYFDSFCQCLKPRKGERKNTVSVFAECLCIGYSFNF